MEDNKKKPTNLVDPDIQNQKNKGKDELGGKSSYNVNQDEKIKLTDEQRRLTGDQNWGSKNPTGKDQSRQLGDNTERLQEEVDQKETTDSLKSDGRDQDLETKNQDRKQDGKDSPNKEDNRK